VQVINTERAIGFAPVARADARILILGSLPGQRSLAASKYYAHPQNSFWRIMAETVSASGSYAARCAALMDARIALWDVLANSVRPGSLDASIDLSTAVVNDFDDFLDRHRCVALILFNGRKAAQVYRRHVAPMSAHPDIHLTTLPSTSPAHAAMSYADKLQRWRAVLT
jgi:double-stranded uracil-DNA glycosylase